MATSLFSSPLILAETTEPTASGNTQILDTEVCSPWVVSTVALGCLVLFFGIWTTVKLGQKQKAIAKIKKSNSQLQEDLDTIRNNWDVFRNSPDLAAAQVILLDYIRMRMDEEVFHYLVINQIRTGITELIGASLRRTVEIPEESRSSNGSGLQINEILDIIYDIEVSDGQWYSGVLFRLDLKLSKLPTQSSSNTINQMVECIEVFLSHSIQQPRWTSDLQGCLITLAWDEKSRPIPLLCLEQSDEKKAKEKSRSFIGIAL